MMATTHALAGLLLGGVAATLAPDLAVPALVAGFLGGAAPDLDLYAGHRKTLHFPVYGPIAGLAAGGVAVLVTGPVTVAVAVFVLAAGLHALSDAVGGGLELRPWRGESDRAVYDHYRGRWIPPRRWIRYDGAPEDLLLCTVLALPGLVALNGRAETAILAALAVSVAYTLARKPLVALADRFVPQIPQDVFDRLPDRLVSFVAPYR
jgi:hypothetical protein